MESPGLSVQYNLLITNWGEDLHVPISGERLFDTVRCTKIVGKTVIGGRSPDAVMFVEGENVRPHRGTQSSRQVLYCTYGFKVSNPEHPEPCE